MYALLHHLVPHGLMQPTEGRFFLSTFPSLEKIVNLAYEAKTETV
jgi:hypothetical protein